MFDRTRSSQHGVVFFTVLIALVILSLSAVALVRSVDTGTQIAGNLSFRQTTTQAGDSGTEAAVTWMNAQLTANPTSLYKSDKTKGYYATSHVGCDLSGSSTPDDSTDDVNWGGNKDDEDKYYPNCKMTAVAVDAARLPAGYSAAYVINRLCGDELPPTDEKAFCESYSRSTAAADEGRSMSGGGYFGKKSASSEYFYRVTTRVVGPKNTVSYVQTVLLN
ncbi:hypothetical protein [Thauera sp. 2A1]|uniref:pilus assembly PilX family protein n=1 Tax=Thauera sp. 2A1 TaxID=2570191 RepID=UPI001291B2B3|nr:hypothetical protein [Thauera sp. 2A1]KAI5916016.1 hypothetical protein GH664_03660 [Thauera sp. 2A1]